MLYTSDCQCSNVSWTHFGVEFIIELLLPSLIEEFPETAKQKPVTI